MQRGVNEQFIFGRTIPGSVFWQIWTVFCNILVVVTLKWPAFSFFLAGHQSSLFLRYETALIKLIYIINIIQMNTFVLFSSWNWPSFFNTYINSKFLFTNKILCLLYIQFGQLLYNLHHMVKLNKKKSWHFNSFEWLKAHSHNFYSNGSVMQLVASFCLIWSNKFSQRKKVVQVHKYKMATLKVQIYMHCKNVITKKIK